MEGVDVVSHTDQDNFGRDVLVRQGLDCVSEKAAVSIAETIKFVEHQDRVPSQLDQRLADVVRLWLLG